MFQTQAWNMALMKVIAEENMCLFFFFPVVCNHMHCKTMLIWMGWKVSQKNYNWLVEKEEGKKRDVVTILIQDKVFHKQKGNKLFFTSPRANRHDDVFKLQQVRFRLHNRKSFTAVRVAKHCNKLSGEFAKSSSSEAAECVGKITPKNDTCTANAPAPRGWWPLGIPPALLCGCYCTGLCKAQSHKVRKRKSKSQSISFGVI